jgi:hypothetical protein
MQFSVWKLKPEFVENFTPLKCQYFMAGVRCNSSQTCRYTIFVIASGCSTLYWCLYLYMYQYTTSVLVQEKIHIYIYMYLYDQVKYYNSRFYPIWIVDWLYWFSTGPINHTPVPKKAFTLAEERTSHLQKTYYFTQWSSLLPCYIIFSLQRTRCRQAMPFNNPYALAGVDPFILVLIMQVLTSGHLVLRQLPPNLAAT